MADLTLSGNYGGFKSVQTTASELQQTHTKNVCVYCNDFIISFASQLILDNQLEKSTLQSHI